MTAQSNTMPRYLPVLALALAIAAANVYVFYLGFIASDDSLYNSFATAIASGDLTLPERHWAFRYTVIFPLSALIAIAGVSEQTIVYLTLGYLALLLALVIWLAYRFISSACALYLALIASTTPLLITLSTTLNADIPEALFLLASVATFYVAWYHRPERHGLFLFAGVAAGFAMLTRETAYGIGLFYALYFLRYATSRLRAFVFLALGTFIVVGLEMAAYVAAGESPLYRLITATASHGGLNAAGEAFASGSGNLSDSRVWGPPLSMLFNQEFGLLFWLGIGCAIALRKHRRLDDETRRFLNYLYVAAAVYFIWLGYSGTIRPLPRYFTFNLLIMMFPIAVFISVTPRAWLKALILLAATGANYAGLAVDNINQRFPERAIAQYAIKVNASVGTDDETSHRAQSFLKLMGGGELRIVNIDAGSVPAWFAAVDGRYEDEPALLELLAHAEKVDRQEPPKLFIGRILDLTRLGTLLPPDKYWWLAVRTPGIDFYRLPLTDQIKYLRQETVPGRPP